GTPGCVTVTAVPAMLSVPARCKTPPFAPAVNETVPGPDPVAPTVTVSQVAPLDAVHAQPAPVDTVNVPEPPPAATACVLGDTVNVHAAAVMANVLETALADVPPGPIVDTRASYVTPATSGVASSDTKSTLMSPSRSGAGLPRLTP